MTPRRSHRPKTDATPPPPGDVPTAPGGGTGATAPQPSERTATPDSEAGPADAPGPAATAGPTGDAPEERDTAAGPGHPTAAAGPWAVSGAGREPGGTSAPGTEPAGRPAPGTSPSQAREPGAAHTGPAPTTTEGPTGDAPMPTGDAPEERDTAAGPGHPTAAAGAGRGTASGTSRAVSRPADGAAPVASDAPGTSLTARHSAGARDETPTPEPTGGAAQRKPAPDGRSRTHRSADMTGTPRPVSDAQAASATARRPAAAAPPPAGEPARRAADVPAQADAAASDARNDVADDAPATGGTGPTARRVASARRAGAEEQTDAPTPSGTAPTARRVASARKAGGDAPDRRRVTAARNADTAEEEGVRRPLGVGGSTARAVAAGTTSTPAKNSGRGPAKGTGGGGRGGGGTPRPRAGGVRAAKPLGDDDRGRLLYGSHHDPHAILGAHPVRGGIQLRVLRPHALSVTVVAKGLRAELNSDGDGFFSGVLPQRTVPDYRLLVTYEGHEDGFEVEDPYRFLPALGDLDLYLIGEGRHEELWKALGAHLMTHQGVTGTRFTVWAPDAQGVRVVGDFNFWDGTGHPMRSLGATGVWELFLPGVAEGTLYKFEITRPDGCHTQRADPMARRTEVPPANASIVTASQHVWQDGEWMAHRGDRPVHEAPFSVYEVHLPSWRPGLTYRQLAEQLPRYVKELGFTHVEFMPVAEHPFGGSWGYQVTGFYAPTSRMGTPDDFRFLVDSLHRAGIGVLVDWVPAHFPRDDWALAQFDGRPLYEHSDPTRAAHPDWGTLEFDYGRKEVRNFLVANATYWCEEFHIDGLRVDAVASMLYLDYSREDGQWSPNEHGGRENLDAVSFLQEMNATVYRRNPGVVTIAEESTAWNGVTRPTDHGGLGFGLKWNMGWMHDSLQYVSKEPVHRKFHHNEMTFSMVYAYSENYVLPISHDEVVHGKRALVSKMPGDWWQQRANHRAYLGFMWAHPGKQLLFMGQEFAQGAEWSEGHGPDWWLLDPSYSAEPDHRGVRDLVRELNAVYGKAPELWQLDTVPEGFAWVDGGAAEDNVFAFLRFGRDGTPLLSVSNFSPVVRHDFRLGVPESVSAWREVLNTDEERFGGSGVRNADPMKPEQVESHGRRTSIAPTLPPLATIWLRPT